MKRFSSSLISADNNNNSQDGWPFKKPFDRIVRVCKSADFFIFCVIVCSLIPVLFILIFGVSKSRNKFEEMVNDGLTTVQEMVKVLIKAEENCQRNMKNDPPPLNSMGEYYTSYCKAEWDQLTCWPNSAPGTTVSVNCPNYIEDFDHNGKAQRMCGPDGRWSTVINASQVWSDYSGCRYPQEEEVVKLIKEGDPMTKSLILLYTIGYSFSLVALIFAVIILAYFKRLHCTRNFIHMHLFVSFILRAVSIFVKDRVLYHGSGIMDIKTKAMENLSESFKPQDDSSFVGCKIVMTLFHYFVATNYYWILVEALYLHSLIFVAFFSDKKYLWRFTLTGWGVPILFVVPWAVVRATLVDTGCWGIAVTEFKWIYNGPIVVANVINFLLFLNIIRVLWSKMRSRGRPSVGRADKNSRQYIMGWSNSPCKKEGCRRCRDFAYKNKKQCPSCGRKLAKSTLVLIPMFGVHAIVFIGMPDNITSGTWWQIRMYFDLFFNSFQGFFVAIIYCFCNGEVQAEFKKAWRRFRLSFEIQKGRKERSRSSVTMLTSFNSSTSQQGRLSIGGQSSHRGGRSGTAPLLPSSGMQDGRTPIVLAKAENPCYRGKDETSFIEKSANGKPQVEEQAPLVLSRPPFIRGQSASLLIGNDVILPIEEEKELDLDLALESALERQMQCPAGSFGLADVREDPLPPADLGCDVVQQVNEFDDVMTSEESRRMTEKLNQRSRRAASEDSGISSTSTFYSVLRGRERNTSASNSATNSDYCGDSEGYGGDDVKRASDIDSLSSSHRDNDIAMTCNRESVAIRNTKSISESQL